MATRQSASYARAASTTTTSFARAASTTTASSPNVGHMSQAPRPDAPTAASLEKGADHIGPAVLELQTQSNFGEWNKFIAATTELARHKPSSATVDLKVKCPNHTRYAKQAEGIGLNKVDFSE